MSQAVVLRNLGTWHKHLQYPTINQQPTNNSKHRHAMSDVGGSKPHPLHSSAPQGSKFTVQTYILSMCTLRVCIPLGFPHVYKLVLAVLSGTTTTSKDFLPAILTIGIGIVPSLASYDLSNANRNIGDSHQINHIQNISWYSLFCKQN